VITVPLLAGAVQEMLTVPLLLAVAVTPVGVPSGAMKTTWLEAADAGPVPTPSVPITVKLYESPAISPDTQQAGFDPLGLMVGDSAVTPFRYGVSVAEMIAPPLLPHVQVTYTMPS
jgi:hypothetical protein